MMIKPVFKQRIKPFLFACALPLLTACQGKHLDILPDLDDPSLVSKKLSVMQMHEDMDALLNGALERHPNLSRYTNVDSLQSKVELLKQQVAHPMTRTEFYKVIGQMNHLFNDGHAFLIWPYQEYNTLKEQGEKPFPFSVGINRTQNIYVQHDYRYEDKLVPAESEILKINGVASKALVEKLQLYSGGESQLLREKVVAERFPVGLWAVFDMLNDFDIEYRYQGEIHTVSITKQQDWQSQTKSNDSDYYYKELANNVGYLYLDHFDIKPSQFEDFIDETFTTINQKKHDALIIDIRTNPGGNTDTVTYLSRYLADKPFRLISSMQEKLNQDNRGLFNYKGEVGEIIESPWDDWQDPVNEAQRFKGKTYLLTGSISYSAAIVLATTLKDNGFATLVGEATEGYANQSAQGNLFNLPHSQLRAYITTRLLVRPSGALAQTGVNPHYVVEPSNRLTHTAEDSTIAATLALIEQQVK